MSDPIDIATGMKLAGYRVKDAAREYKAEGNTAAYLACMTLQAEIFRDAEAEEKKSVTE